MWKIYQIRPWAECTGKCHSFGILNPLIKDMDRGFYKSKDTLNAKKLEFAGVNIYIMVKYIIAYLLIKWNLKDPDN